MGLLIVLAIGYVTVRPLLGPGYFPMHDDTQVARVVEMGRAIREGQFPVRWVSDLGYGYGYPIFNFYGPLPYYVGGTLYALGVSGLAATKIMMGLGLVLAGLMMYLAIGNIAGISAGVLAAAFYMLAPYHAVQAYVRGAVGEYWALIFLPLILWGYWNISIRKNFRSGLLLGAAGVTGLVISHTILGYAGMIFVVLGGVLTIGVNVRRQGEKQISYAASALILLGLGLSAFFWLPAITEMKYTNVASQISVTSDFRDHFVCLPQLWNSAWGYGGSAKGCLDGLSFKVGKEHLLLALAALIAMALGLVRNHKGKWLLGIGAGIFLLSVFFMMSVSQPVWDVLPLFAYVQYPWRFLAFAIFGISIAVSTLVYAIRQQWLRWIAVAICLGIVLFVETKRFVPQYMYDRPSTSFESAADIEYRVSKISDEYLPPAVPRPKSADQIVRDIIPPSVNYTVRIQQNTDTYKKFEFLVDKDSKVQVPVAYFPGWEYHVNEFTIVPPIVNGLPVLTVPSGLDVVQMQFTDTPVRRGGNILSLISLGVCLYIYDKRKKTNS